MDFKTDQDQLDLHLRLMGHGCIHCMARGIGAICPDCYCCPKCGDGCEECRLISAHPCISRKKRPQGGPDGTG